MTQTIPPEKKRQIYKRDFGWPSFEDWKANLRRLLDYHGCPNPLEEADLAHHYRHRIGVDAVSKELRIEAGLTEEYSGI